MDISSFLCIVDYKRLLNSTFEVRHFRSYLQFIIHSLIRYWFVIQQSGIHYDNQIIFLILVSREPYRQTRNEIKDRI